MKNIIHIHIGPHKTGSTALQRFIHSNSEAMLAQSGVQVLDSDVFGQVAKAFADKKFDVAEGILSDVAKACLLDNAREFLVSNEDFSGELPGRSRSRKPYRQLWQNIRVFEKSFQAFERRYYFLERPPEDWIRSAYHQSLKYRAKFSSFDQFCTFIQKNDLWDQVINKSIAKLGDRLNLIPYSSDVGDSTIERVFQSVGIPLPEGADVSVKKSANVSPTDAVIRLLELINSAGSSTDAKRSAKALLLGWEKPSADPLNTADANERTFWETCSPVLAPPASLSALWQRVETRRHKQDQPDLLPPSVADLGEARYDIIEVSGDFPTGGRDHMERQSEILRYRFNGYPEICYLLGLSISYLRRDTVHGRKAAIIFQELWATEYAVLLAVLPTRWIISSFQTFMEYGVSEPQRQIGGSGFFFANLLKAYEAERSFEGLQPGSTYPFVRPQTAIGFAGLDRFKLGGSDLMLNTLALMLELSTKERTSGRVLQEFLLRLKAGHSVFSRMDQSRLAHKIEIPQFSNCWSFFEPPSRNSN